MKILTLTGWAQQPDILQQIIDIESDYLDYMHLDINQIKKQLKGKQYDMIIGWSLGGQVALDVAAIVGAKALILAACPVRFVSDAQFDMGITPKNFLQFKADLIADKYKLLTHFQNLINHGDHLAKEIKSQMPICGHYQELDLLYWLEYLGNFDIRTKSLGQLRRIKFIFGANDQLVKAEHLNYFKDFLPDHHSDVIADASHVAFYSDQTQFQNLCYEFFRKTNFR
jgi:pimeloyl-ACP methyl ester carboxylesterase